MMAAESSILVLDHDQSKMNFDDVLYSHDWPIWIFCWPWFYLFIPGARGTSWLLAAFPNSQPAHISHSPPATPDPSCFSDCLWVSVVFMIFRGCISESSELGAPHGIRVPLVWFPTGSSGELWSHSVFVPRGSKKATTIILTSNSLYDIDTYECISLSINFRDLR